MPTNTIKAIIVDDERLARNELKKLLEQHPEIEVVDEASNVDEGVEKIDITRPDLIFLDIPYWITIIGSSYGVVYLLSLPSSAYLKSARV